MDKLPPETGGKVGLVGVKPWELDPVDTRPAAKTVGKKRLPPRNVGHTSHQVVRLVSGQFEAGLPQEYVWRLRESRIPPPEARLGNDIPVVRPDGRPGLAHLLFDRVVSAQPPRKLPDAIRRQGRPVHICCGPLQRFASLDSN